MSLRIVTGTRHEYPVNEMVHSIERKEYLRLQKKQGCANMDTALDRYINSCGMEA